MKIRIPLLVLATAFAGTSVIARQAGTPAPRGAAPAATTPAGGAEQIPAAPGAQRGGPQPSPFSTPPLRVFIYAGLKTHCGGAARLSAVSRRLEQAADEPQRASSTAACISRRRRSSATRDVLVIYKGDAGYLSMEDRANLDAYMRRGGGLVSIHDALCGPDPAYFATLVGGAKKHGEVNYTLEADVAYTIVDTAHPIMQGMTNFKHQGRSVLLDDVGEDAGDSRARDRRRLRATPSAQRTGHAGRSRAADLDVREAARCPAPTGQPYRAFVWMQGHNYANFANPQIQPMLLRGIAWAGKPLGRHADDRTSRARRRRRHGTDRRCRTRRAQDRGARTRDQNRRDTANGCWNRRLGMRG